MRAAILTADRPNLAIADVADPVAGSGDVVVSVSGCGVCGSDLHVTSMLAAEGSILGHEIAGVIEDIGAGVDGWRIGASVAVRPIAGCGRCDQCERGRPDHCPSFKLLGYDRAGGFAPFVSVDARELFALSAGIDPVQQPLVEPLAVARRAARRAGLRSSDRVAILGGGPIGLAVAAWARTLGVERLLVSEPSPLRRDLAAALGAIPADPTSAALGETVRAALGAAPTVVFECSGRAGLIQQAMELADVDARVVVVGICPSVDEFFPWTGISKELDVRFAIYYGREDFDETIAALDSHRLDAAAMVTEEINLDALPARFARLVREPDAGKVIVRP